MSVAKEMAKKKGILSTPSTKTGRSLDDDIVKKRTGPSRIPVFGPRIPISTTKNLNENIITLQNPHSEILVTQRRKTSDEVTVKDIGKKVRIADKEGILRFVGNVHFTTGVWCGVELSNAVGKNDGVVRGVRYFVCPTSCGLMAPRSKVSLIDEIAEDATSGPYSMIFDANDQLVNNAYADNKFHNSDESYQKKQLQPLGKSETFDKLEYEDKISLASLSSVCNANITFVQKDNDQRSNHTTNTTQIKCDTVLNIPPIKNVCNDSVQNKSEECNETIINISITNRGRVFNMSHSDKEILNVTPNKDLSRSCIKTFENITLDVKSDHTWLNTTTLRETPKNKVPSELNLRSLNETVILKNINESYDRPKSYPITENYFSPIKTAQMENSAIFTPMSKETDGIFRRSLVLSPMNQNTEDESNKRDSLDFDESLGILTPDQMVDNLSCYIASPSSENIPSLLNDINISMKYQKDSDIVSPNIVDSSIKDYSLGVIDVNEVSMLLSDTTMNIELPLDIDNKKDFTLTRIEQTPSPEELPLDPAPIVDSDPKLQPSQSKTTNNFITSITSITSIDTGYQGDGEMSRPASRGPDNSPLTRRPLTRPQPRRPDPMTDSDFYTESDADNHEEHPLRGDRRAQVIDGTLYGVDPQAAADIYVNNRENMDSSGIFTDLESNLRTEKLSDADENIKLHQSIDISPSDSSSKTISDNSQDSALITPKTPTSTESPDSKNISDSTIKEISPKRHTPSPSTVTSTPVSIRSPRHSNKDDGLKKYKMPKRNVTSKVKAMLEPNSTLNIEKKPPIKKTINRWDTTMNKISKVQDQNKSTLTETKPRVFTTITTTSTIKITPSTTSNRTISTQKSPNSKLRRIRSRATTNVTPTKNKTITNIESSIYSSLSDLSGAFPVKKIGSAKKPREVVCVTQVLTASKLSPKTNNRTANEVRKTPVSSTLGEIKSTNRKNIFTSKDKKKNISTKECSRTTTKGGRLSPVTRPLQQQRASVAAPPRITEALAVLVQHLVFNLGAFKIPLLRKEVEKVKLEAEEARLSCLQLEEKLLNEKARYSATIEQERARYKAEITALIEQHRNTVAELKSHYEDIEQRLKQDCQNIEARLIKLQEEQLQTLKVEYGKFQKMHAETVDILREENDAIREEIDIKNAIIEKLKYYKFESEKLKKDCEAKEVLYKEQLQMVNEENFKLKDENEALLNYNQPDGNNSIQEVQSLRAVLELKLADVADLRKALAKASEKAEQLPVAEEKIATLSAKCEDLLSQLERKNVVEMQITQEKIKLEESLTEETNQNKRLKQRNEELQWKIQQNKEIMNRVLEQAEEGGFNRSVMSASFNERHLSTRPTFERTQSFKEKVSIKSTNSGDTFFSAKDFKNSYDLDVINLSPPSSPKVKGVVEKSDSVSYVLEMDDSPDVAASRILRRSFRNSTPPKNTPTKSPSNKRPRMKNNSLSLSASTSAIPMIKVNHVRSRSISIRTDDYDSSSNNIFLWESPLCISTPCNKSNICDDIDTYQSCSTKCNLNLYNKQCYSSRPYNSDYKLEDNLDLDDDVDIKLPSLPSEIGRNNDIQSLPVPRHLAGEAMISENNSDDESTTSSSSGQL